MAEVKNRKDPPASSERMTATDTLNLNPAFISRVKKEEGTQQSAMAQKLRQDMDRMKEEQMFADMQFVSDSQSIPGHKLVLRSRLKNVFDDLWYENSSEGLPVLRIHTATGEETKEFMKVLYTSDDVDTKFVLDALKKSNTVEVDSAKAESDSSPTTSDPEQHVSDKSSTSSQEHTAPAKDGHHVEPAKSGSPTEDDDGNDLTAQSEPGESRPSEAAAVSASVDNQGDGHFQVTCFQKDPSQISSSDKEPRSPGVSGNSGQEKSSAHMKSGPESIATIAQAVSDSEVIITEPPMPNGVSSSPQTAHCDSLSDSERGGHEKSCPEESLPEQEAVANGSTLQLGTDTESPHTTAVSVSASASRTLTKEPDADASSQENLVDASANSSAQHQNNRSPALTGELQQPLPNETPEPGVPTTTPTTSIFAGGSEDVSQKQGAGDAGPCEISYAACSGLADGLLQCYLQQDYTDCCLKVEGHQFLAHRCILASRCLYFEAMFAGVWTESGEAEIELHSVSARAVKYMLLFLYGAMLEVPAADITPLIQASDMFGVEGLKDWLGFLIARDFCHFFHKPCQDCIRMVADVLVLASQFNLTSLAERGKRWVTTHFRRIWEMPNFSSLPPDLLAECTKSVIDQMSVQNITLMLLDSHVLVRCLQQNRRAPAVQLAALQVMDAALAFCAAHFPRLVRSPRFLSWSKDGAWCMDVLEESYTMVVSLLQPEVACDVYSALQQLLADSHREDGGAQYTSQEVQRLLKKLVERCEWYLHRYIHRVVDCPQWSALPTPLQQQLLQKCSFVPAHAASLSGAKSRVAQKSAKVLQDNIVHTVTMLCETNPDLFPSLAQTRKILSDSSKQPPPTRHRPPAKTSESRNFPAGGKSQTVGRKAEKESPATVRQSEASKKRNTAESASSSWRSGSGKGSAPVSQGTAKQKKASSGAPGPASAPSQGKGLPASSAQRSGTAAATSAASATKAAASSLSGSRPHSASVTSTRSQGRAASSVTQPARGVKAAEPSSAGSRPQSAAVAPAGAKTACRSRAAASRPQSASASLVTQAAQEAKGTPSSASARADSAKTSSSRNAVTARSTRPAGGAGRTSEGMTVATGSSAPRQKESQPLASRPSSASAKGTSAKTSAQGWNQRSGLLSKSSSKHASGATHSGVKSLSPGVSGSVTSRREGSGPRVETSRTTQRANQASSLKTARPAAASTGTRAKPPSARLPKGGSQPPSGQSSTSRPTLKAQSTTTKTTSLQASHTGKSLSKPDRQTSSHSAANPVGSKASEVEEKKSASRQHSSTPSTREEERHVKDAQSEATPVGLKTSDLGHSDPEGASAGGNLDFTETQTADLDSDNDRPVLSEADASPQSWTADQTQSNGPENSVSFASSETASEQIQNSVQDISSENDSLFIQKPGSENAQFENSESVLAADSEEKADDDSQALHDSRIVGANELLEVDTHSTNVRPQISTSTPTRRDDSVHSVGRRDVVPAPNIKTDPLPSETGELAADTQHEDSEETQVFDQGENRLQNRCDKVQDRSEDSCHTDEASRHHGENKTLFQEDDSETTTGPHRKDRNPELEEQNTKATEQGQEDGMAQDLQDNEMARDLQDGTVAQGLQDDGMAQDLQDEAVAQGLQDYEMAQDLQDDEMAQDLQDHEMAQDLQDHEMEQDLQDGAIAQGLQGDEMAQGLQLTEVAQNFQDNGMAQGLRDYDMVHCLQFEGVSQNLQDDEKAQDLQGDGRAQDLQADGMAQDLQDNNIALDLQDDKMAQYPQGDGMAQDLQDNETAPHPQDEEPARNPQDDGRDMTSSVVDKEKASDLEGTEGALDFLG